jgi:hypothetical protein
MFDVDRKRESPCLLHNFVQLEATLMSFFTMKNGGLKHCVYCLSIRLTLPQKHLGANKLRYPVVKSCERML